ncbi:MAG: tetratricopeptide repeat protein [Candidatus Saganbacteria bacterium]|nr:tetratricopeptide repeat protein [Candidatus Saganbacteria bacterium]
MNKLTKINLNSSQIFNFAIEILILVVIFVMPTIFDRRLGIVFSGTKTTWMRVLGLIILSLWAIKIIICKKHPFVRTPLDWPILSFMLCTTIASLTSFHVYTSIAGFYGRYEGLTSWYLFFLFFFVITNYIKSLEQIKRIIVTVLSAATLMAVYSIIQRHELDPYRWGGVVTWQRVIGTIGQPNFIAAYMLMAFFLVLGLFLLKKKEPLTPFNWFEQFICLGYFVFGQIVFLVMIFNINLPTVASTILWYLSFLAITISVLLFSFSYNKLSPKIFNLVLGIGLVLIYICILYTQSRGGYLGLFTGIVLFVIVCGRQAIFDNWKKIAILGSLIILISAVTMTRAEFSPFERFASEISTKKASVSSTAQTKLELKGAAGSRGETWKSAFAVIADYPVFGIGPEVLKMIFPRYETELFRFREAFHVKQDRCHNEIFDVAVTKGLIAFFVYLWLLFVVFRVGWLKSRKADGNVKPLLAAMLAAVLSFLIQNQFSFGVVAITSLFWIIWGMIMVVPPTLFIPLATRDKEETFSWQEIPWIPVAMVIILSLLFVYISFFSFRGDLWFKSGKTKSLIPRPAEAVNDYQKSLSVFPFEGGAISHLGIAYLNFSNTLPPEERLEYIEKAVTTLKYGTQIDPYNADNFYMLSKIFLMLQMPDKAQEHAEIAIKIDPYYAEVYQILGIIYARQKEFDKAAQHFKRAFFINPNLVEPMQNLKDLYRSMGKGPEILLVFEKALDKYGDNLVVLEEVGDLYLEQGKAEKAFTVSQRMIALNPDLSAGYILRARANLGQGKIRAASLDLQDVLIRDPKNIDAHNLLGALYGRQGNVSRAREEFEQVLVLDPNNAFAKKMLKQLR